MIEYNRELENISIERVLESVDTSMRFLRPGAKVHIHGNYRTALNGERNLIGLYSNGISFGELREENPEKYARIIRLLQKIEMDFGISPPNSFN